MDQKAQRLARLKQWKQKEKPKEDSKPQVQLNVKFKKARPQRVRLDSSKIEPAKLIQHVQPDMDAFLSNLSSNYESTNLDLDDELDLQNQLVATEPAARKKHKEMPIIDHSKVEYKPFKRKFYEGENPTCDIPGITVSHPLKPISQWEFAGFPRPVLDLIHQKNYEVPTLVQSVTAAAILGGNDVMAIAPTGSGKTMAFVLPVLRHVQGQHFSQGDGPIAIILAPTRELCAQIYTETLPFAEALKVGCCCAYGGSDIKPQIDSLIKGQTQIIIATPGRLIDLLAANRGRVLSTTKTSIVVIDEADRMFDMGFSPQVYRILDSIRPDNQTVLCSATFSQSMQDLAAKTLKKAVHIQVGENSQVGKQISQDFKLLDPQQKLEELVNLLDTLEPPYQAIVFVERQEVADDIASQLLFKGFKCTSLHGGNSQNERDTAIQEFRNGSLDLLVATSVAARGIDVATVKLVVNFDPPNHLEDYVHRVGRTGRAGESGHAVTFFTAGQYKQAHEVVRAVQQVQQVPSEIKELASEYKESWDREGFGGKGLSRLDISRQKTQATTLSVFADEPVVMEPAKIEATAIGYRTTLEFNEFAANARKQVTNLSHQKRIAEEYQVSLTIKGQYNKFGDKLRIVIEGENKAAVLNAYDEFARLLVETPQQGRYNV